MKYESQTTIISKINDILATRITMMVGTIWAFYAFVIFGLTPVLWPGYEEQILYWSNFLQLIFLPIITVGTTIMGRSAEARAAQDHETIQQQFALMQQADDMLHHSLREIGTGVRELLLRVDNRGAATGETAPDTGQAYKKEA